MIFFEILKIDLQPLYSHVSDHVPDHAGMTVRASRPNIMQVQLKGNKAFSYLILSYLVQHSTTISCLSTVEPSWSEWEQISFEACSQTCGVGEKTNIYKRECTGPESSREANSRESDEKNGCSGEDKKEETESCNLGSCPGK